MIVSTCPSFLFPVKYITGPTTNPDMRPNKIINCKKKFSPGSLVHEAKVNDERMPDNTNIFRNDGMFSSPAIREQPH